jgi:hypothetical protein
MPENNQSQEVFDSQGIIKLDQPQTNSAPNAAPVAANAEVKVGEVADKNPQTTTEKKEAEVKPSDVYAMPKEFQYHNRVAGSNTSFWGVMIVFFSFVFLVVVGVGFYLYMFNPGILSDLSSKIFGIQSAPIAETPVQMATATPASPESIAEQNEATSTEAMPEISPSQIYQDYLKELAKINTFEDYYILITKYGNKQKFTAVEGERLVAEATTESDKSSVKALKEKIPALRGSDEIKEEINEDTGTALLTIALSDGKATGTVQFTLENGAWKLGQESWTQTKAEDKSYTMGEDRDGDGLLDAEEDLLGSNKESVDSEKDGYGDLKETLNLYNPVDTNKLVDNTRIKSYLADDKSFYFLYPSTWRRVNDKGSPIFMGPDNHFFQLVVTPNDKKETLDEYFKRVAEVNQIKDSSRLSSDTWTGIKTDDGLTVYIMDLKKTNVYVFHYNPGDKNILQYPNIFSVMIKSFVIKK